MIADITVTRPMLELVMSDDAKGVVDALLAAYPAPTLQSNATLPGTRFAAMRKWSEFFVEHPILLSPTWALPAFKHGADIDTDQVDTIMGDTLRPVMPGNLLGIPAAVVPCGMAAGLPVGAQVMGDHFTDLRCLDIAEQIQAAEGVHTPIDPVTA